MQIDQSGLSCSPSARTARSKCAASNRVRSRGQRQRAEGPRGGRPDRHGGHSEVRPGQVAGGRGRIGDIGDAVRDLHRSAAARHRHIGRHHHRRPCGADQIPIAQFPDIVPPQVSVTASYPGASAAVVQDSIAQPIESQVIGVDRMIYMKSTSGNDGSYTLNVSFAVGTAPDINTVNVQNRVALAEAKLPQEARAQGVSVKKKSSALLQLIAYIARRQPRSALPFQLCDDQYRRWPEAHTGRRGRGPADAVGLQHAHLDHPRAPDELRPDAERRRQCAQGPEHPGRDRPHRRSTGAARSAVPADDPDQGTLTAVEEFEGVVLKGLPDGSFARARRGAGRARPARRGADRTAGRHPGRRDRRLPVARRQRHRQRGTDPEFPREAQAVVPRGCRIQDHLRHDGLRRGEHPRGRQDPARGLRARRHRRVSLPRQRPPPSFR